MKKLLMLIIAIIMFIVTVGCGSDDSSSYCDHGNRIYPHGVAANDPSCPR